MSLKSLRCSRSATSILAVILLTASSQASITPIAGEWTQRIQGRLPGGRPLPFNSIDLTGMTNICIGADGDQFHLSVTLANGTTFTQNRISACTAPQTINCTNLTSTHCIGDMRFWTDDWVTEIEMFRKDLTTDLVVVNSTTLCLKSIRANYGCAWDYIELLYDERNAPTGHPTTAPSANPTRNPSTTPTKNPTQNPTKNPTQNPSPNPTANPTRNPTKNPTNNPTKNPTANPTANPTKNPTQNPTKNPTANPTKNPTANPTKNPTRNPTVNPTRNPTANPTRSPTFSPLTSEPSKTPTNNPSNAPTSQPTSVCECVSCCLGERRRLVTGRTTTNFFKKEFVKVSHGEEKFVWRVGDGQNKLEKLRALAAKTWPGTQLRLSFKDAEGEKVISDSEVSLNLAIEIAEMRNDVYLKVFAD